MSLQQHIDYKAKSECVAAMQAGSELLQQQHEVPLDAGCSSTTTW